MIYGKDGYKDDLLNIESNKVEKKIKIEDTFFETAKIYEDDSFMPKSITILPFVHLK